MTRLDVVTSGPMDSFTLHSDSQGHKSFTIQSTHHPAVRPHLTSSLLTSTVDFTSASNTTVVTGEDEVD
jgi:hypothetical protein